MKSFFMGTTALVAASMAATAAQAAEWDVRVGGYYNAMVAYAQTDAVADPNEVNLGSDGEVFFLPSITLDNGIRIGANIQLDLESDQDGDGDGDVIDEAFVFVAGYMGEIQFGQTDGVFSTFSDGIIPGMLGQSLNNNDEYNLDPFAPYDVDTGLTWTSLRNRINLDSMAQEDAVKISYITPSFDGFRLGASFAPNPCKNDTGFSDCVDEEFGRNTWEVAVDWRYSWEDKYGLRLYGAYLRGESGDSRNTPTETSLGGALAVGPFTGGVQYTLHDLRYEDPWSTKRFDDKDQFIGSLTYEQGPVRILAQIGESTSGNRKDDFYLGGISTDGEYDGFLLGAQYNIGAGFDVGVVYQHFNFERDTRGGITNEFETDGSALSVGVGLRF